MKDVVSFLIFLMVIIVVAYPITRVVALVAQIVCPSDCLKRLWCWLKGSRVSYYLRSGSMISVSGPLRRANEGRIIDDPFIEVKNGPWGRKAVIYGNSGRWTIIKTSENPFDGSDKLFLHDKGGQSVETVLRAVAAGQFFPALVNRIAELEQALLVSRELCEAVKKQYQMADKQIERLQCDLDFSKSRLLDTVASILAIINLAKIERQRYRSEPAKTLRSYLEVAMRWGRDRDRHISFPENKHVAEWMERLPKMGKEIQNQI